MSVSKVLDNEGFLVTKGLLGGNKFKTFFFFFVPYIFLVPAVKHEASDKEAVIYGHPSLCVFSFATASAGKLRDYFIWVSSRQLEGLITEVYQVSLLLISNSGARHKREQKMPTSRALLRNKKKETSEELKWKSCLRGDLKKKEKKETMK